ncbi:TetR family transcriptional regulator [Thalassobacillus devorans]|uniref:TetR family transcriptional regulator n=1 Tax=Thalassobacillus devorans TaxID=279813 RepID=A0ABQ1NKK0_9BACI|nr:TetR/AcrR family transcriptional regulator [Thalassobacillus devorans]NIK27348.1 AcrR family transcriptional regulator [Thalassobacillus devorans]GGC77038.1 TetR family transcriptional regulator [Thalassobacillus devorans]
MAKKTDLRVKRTRILINEAFLKVIQMKGFDAMTIQDIADEALINRSTFYLHYDDKYDLLEKMSSDVIQELISVINPPFDQADQELLKGSVTNVYQCIQKHQMFYQVMFGKNGINGFRNKLEEVIRDKFDRHIKEVVKDPTQFQIPKDLLLHFISAAFVGIIQWWLNQDEKPTPEEMANQLSKLITQGPIQTAGFKIE